MTCNSCVSRPISRRETHVSAGIHLTINLTPEMLRGWNGDPSNLRIELRPHLDGGVRVDAPPVHTPPAYTPPPVRAHETRRVHSIGSGRVTGTIREHFFTLMNRRALLQQSDYRLAARALLVPDGGL